MPRWHPLWPMDRVILAYWQVWWLRSSKQIHHIFYILRTAHENSFILTALSSCWKKESIGHFFCIYRWKSGGGQNFEVIFQTVCTSFRLLKLKIDFGAWHLPFLVKFVSKLSPAQTINWPGHALAQTPLDSEVLWSVHNFLPRWHLVWPMDRVILAYDKFDVSKALCKGGILWLRARGSMRHP